MNPLSNLLRVGMLSCLSCFDDETGMFVSHCLNFDLVEFGKTADEAWENLKDSVKQFVQYCYTNSQESLTISADRNEWAEFAELLRQKKTPNRVDIIEFELVPPLPENTTGIWMQGVDEDVGTCTQVQ
jgi:hypothetical protein